MTALSAADIHKGDLPVLHLSEAQVARLLPPDALLDALADGFRRLARGEVQAPPRPEIRVPGLGFSLAMAAWSPGLQITVKVVNVFDGNLELGLPSHLALIALFDPATGAPVCVMDGTHITAMRTAGSAVLSVKLLARPDARVATVIGAGVQARAHLKLLPLVRGFDEVRVASLHFADAERLARLFPRARAVADLEAAVRASDVVCLATHAAEPVIQPDWVRPGTHVTSVGYCPPAGELPPELARRHRLFVEAKDAFEAPPVGCAELQQVGPELGICLGDVLLGRTAGRDDWDEITVYKAMGIAMEDMMAANLVYRRALAADDVQRVTL